MLEGRTFSGSSRTLSIGPYGLNTEKRASLVAFTSKFPIHKLLVGIWGVDETLSKSGVPVLEVCDEIECRGALELELSLDRVKSRSEYDRGLYPKALFG